MNLSIMPIKDDKKDLSDNESQHTKELKAQVEQCAEDLKRSKELLGQEAQERKLTEQALRTAEQEKTAILDSMAEHVIFHDKNMKIVWANRAAAKSVGMTTEELVGMNCYEVWQKRDTICEGCPVIKALETGIPHENEMTIPDGRSWFLHGYPVKDDKGKVIGAVEVAMDLTVLKQAEQALRESERKIRTVFDSTNDAIIIYDLEGHILEVNKTACDRLGYTRDEFLNMTAMNIASPVYAKLVLKRIEELKAKKQHFFETAHVTKDGKIIPVELSSRVIEFDGKPAILNVARDMTQRKRAEVARQESEEMYRTLVETLPEAIIISDLEGKIIHISNQTLELTGYAKEDDIVGKDAFDFIHPDDQHKAQENLRKTLEQGHIEAEYRLLKPDGTYYIGEFNATVIKDAQGKPKAFLASIRDISKKKKVEEALKQSEIRYKSLFDRSLLCIYIHDFEGKFLDANNAALDMLGYKREEMPNINLATLIDADQLSKAYRVIEEIKNIGFQKEAVEYRLLRKDGNFVWVETEGTLLHKDGKSFAIQGIARDITKRVITLEALRQSEQKYKTLTENLNVGIYRNTIGPTGKFIEANPAIVKMFGHESKDAFLTIDVADLYQNPDDRKKFNEKMLVYGYVKDEILLLKRTNGSPFFASVSAVAVKDEQGNVQYYDGMIEDITERIQAEQELKKSYHKLKDVLNGTVNALASTSEKRDPFTFGHQHRVRQLAFGIAEEMGLASDQIDGIRVASIVHDIGKIHVPAEILNKPVSLSDIEMALVKTHCQAGYEILKTIEFPWDVAEMVLQHHERINGSGYPRGLTGDKMLLESKILAVADVVEAMVSHRPYRAAHSIDKALEEITRNRGVLFDARVVDACLRLFGRGFQFE